MSQTATKYKYNAFAIQLQQEHLDRLLSEGKPETDWEVKYRRKSLAEEIAKDNDIASGKLYVIWKNKDTGKYSIKEPEDITNWSWYEKWQLKNAGKKCFDSGQGALCGDSVKKSSIFYSYLPAELMEDGIPYIIGWEVSYDGGQQQKKEVEAGAMVMSYKELHKVFTNNKFE